jgi:Pentapeptide repeats (8 copies)
VEKPSSPRLNPRQRGLLLAWLVAIVATAGFLVLFLWVIPAWLTMRPSLTGADRQKAISDARLGIASVLAVLGTAGGFAYTIRTYRLSRQGQVSDRYIKAIEQLSNGNPDIRIGGIYALYQTTRDAPEYQDTAIEVLAAYIRNRTPWPNTQAAASRVSRPANGQADAIFPQPDIRNAMTVLRDLTRSVSKAGLDLSHSNLAGADLIEMYLVDANLTNTNLYGAKLSKADMRGADLRGAELTNAQLYGANFTDVRLNRDQINRTALSDVKGLESIQWIGS